MRCKSENILKGKTIIRTYPDYEEDKLDDILRSAGACVFSMPVIAIAPVPFRLKKDSTDYDWMVFTSKNAVSHFFSQHAATGKNRIAALGQGTARALSRAGYPPHFTGEGKSGVHFAKGLQQVIPPEEQVLLVLGTLAPDSLETSLRGNHRVERVNVYQTKMPEAVDRDLLARVEEDRYDLLIVTSPSAMHNLWMLLAANKKNLRIISIGQTTTAAIRDYHLEPVATAAEPGYEELAAITINYLMNKKKHIQ
ncbi:MAG: uroporphyrinogen-III synthase [Mangrovibacterium sp.]|nr:uroporphyrinogen-III synthase [Mangrovibacterium sp.]